MFGNNSSKRPRYDALSVDTTAYPGWTTAAERMPKIGEVVYCAGGLGEVVKLCGKTGNGSRLLELRLQDPKSAFFAAATNVLVRPVEE